MPDGVNWWIVGGIILYFVPWAVASSRGKRNAPAIAVLNLFLGWTFVGWVIALVWACTDEAKS
ncbi:hypothetical protein LCGC14_2958120 [marine sediment metagenome]|uniref:Superinfection immunity protein n=1 Tax=marine sediment metagenome TaxID=412755 RepID=A0A0F8ZKU8_9ZZZZ